MNQDLMGFFSRNNLPKSNFMEKIKDGAYIINIDQYTNVSTHWIALFCKKKKNEILYFNSFGVEYIPEEIKTNIFRVQEVKSVNTVQ